MKKITFNNNSLHFHLAKRYGFLSHNLTRFSKRSNSYNGDICSYIRHVLLGVFMACMIPVLMFPFLVCISSTICWIVVMIVTGIYIPPDDYAKGMLIFLGSILAVAICIIITYHIHIHFEKKQLAAPHWEDEVYKKPSFAITAYRSIRDKFCVNIEVK